MTLLSDWREFIELLNSHGVDYVIVGAWAPAFHGVPRSTGDIDPYRIDLLTSISGVTFDEAWNNRVCGEIDGIPTQFLSLDLFQRNERAAGRPKDLADLEALPEQ